MFRVTAFILLVCSFAFGQSLPVRVVSPDSNIEFILSNKQVNSGSSMLVYRVAFRGKLLLKDSELGLELQKGGIIGRNLELIKTEPGSADEQYQTVVGKSKVARNHYNSVRADFGSREAGERKLTIEIRAYDDGVAFRYVVPEQQDGAELRVVREQTAFEFASDAVAYPLILQSFTTSYEDEYQQRQISGLHPKWLIALPLLTEFPGTGWMAITEANIDNYPGMYLSRVPSKDALTTTLSPLPEEPSVAAVVAGPVTTPWRVLMIGSEPGRLIESNIVLNLNPPSAIADTSWIQAGKTAWDWWSGSVAKNVTFQPGMNTATMKHYIDFAAASGIPYMTIDEGWAAQGETIIPGSRRRLADITRTIDEIDMPEILRYAREKNVRVWLWAHWRSVDKYIDTAFPLFEKWGVAGVKIDFMDRDDQWMVNFYRRVLKEAANHKLMINYHGAYKPDGIRRTYPNLMTREGVMGMEYSKWTRRVTPVHNCTLPFTRMLAGPMDYTPGGFGNVTRERFEARNLEPVVMGTRAHHLALYVVFESPVQMVSDYPERYKGEPAFAFVRQVPTTWDETKVLNGEPMRYITIARRSGSEWYVGAITDWSARDTEVDMKFLGNGKYVAEIYADAADATTTPTNVAIRSVPVTKMTKLKLHLVSGGGAAVRIRPSGVQQSQK